jgi:hypothetical protein
MEGSEVYMASRMPGLSQHFSVHQSGVIHYRMGTKNKQDLAPLLRVNSGPWAHAIELRFLTSPDANPPIKMLEQLKKQAFLLPVPNGFALHVNLLIADAGTPENTPLPAEFILGAANLWIARLRDDRLAILIGRALRLSAENLEHIRYVRQELKPTATTESITPDALQMETHHMHWSNTGGNVLLVVPMGAEAFRADDELIDSKEQQRARRFHFRSQPAEVIIRAPDGRVVALVQVEGCDEILNLTKGRPSKIVAGRLIAQLFPDNLVTGSAFSAAPDKLPHNVAIGGAPPRDWAYSIWARFDGTSLSIQFGQLSTSLRNVNLARPIENLDNSEELLLVAPCENCNITLSRDEATFNHELLGRLTLRDIR